MAAQLMMMEARDCQEWRTWLAEHHVSSPGVWLVFRKGSAGAAGLAYEESVREALCFGWIDSLVKRIDDARYARKFTPRQPGSKWSDSNRRRWAELESAGRLAPAGVAAAPTGNSYTPPPAASDLPAYLAAALKANPAARAFFERLAPTYRRHFVGWIDAAKRPETREKRIRESMALLAAGKKLGLK